MEYLGTHKEVNKIKPLVSVCIQTYNNEDYIEQCLTSVLSQRVNFLFEIIVGEDDSTDRNREICKRLADSHPDKIRLFFRSKEDKIFIDGRVTSRFNFVSNLEAARGKYIALLDGDDYWCDLDKLQKQLDKMENDPKIDLCFHNAKVIGDSPYILKENIDSYDKFPWNGIERNRSWYTVDDLILSPLCPSASVMFKRANAFPLPAILYTASSADIPLFIHVCENNKIYYFDEMMSVYRKQKSSISGGHKGKWIARKRLELYLDLLKLRGRNHKAAFKKVIFQNLRQLKSPYNIRKKYLLKLILNFPLYYGITFISYIFNKSKWY